MSVRPDIGLSSYWLEKLKVMGITQCQEKSLSVSVPPDIGLSSYWLDGWKTQGNGYHSVSGKITQCVSVRPISYWLKTTRDSWLSIYSRPSYPPSHLFNGSATVGCPFTHTFLTFLATNSTPLCCCLGTMRDRPKTCKCSPAL